MGTNYYAVRTRPTCEDPIRIGKSSAGWRFLFQSQDEPWHEPPVVWHTYEQVIDWLQKYTVEEHEYVIVNEVDEIMSLDEFKEMVTRKQNLESPVMFSNCRNVHGYRFTDRYFK